MDGWMRERERERELRCTCASIRVALNIGQMVGVESGGRVELILLIRPTTDNCSETKHTLCSVMHATPNSLVHSSCCLSSNHFSLAVCLFWRKKRVEISEQISVRLCITFCMSGFLLFLALCAMQIKS